jgi:hypothetical protein
MSFKLGLKPPRPGAVKLRLATYMNYSTLPTPPAEFGHYDLVTNYGMLANDRVGDCAIAGPMHQQMVWDAESQTPVSFSDATALQVYSEITGYDPTQTAADGSNPTDQGTDIQQMAAYWQKTGMLDDAGKRHQIVAYLDLTPGDLRELWTATWLFQTVTLGFALPDSAQQQFANGEPWDIVRGASIEGGHCVPCMGRKTGLNLGVTWDALQPFTDRWFEKYNNQGIVALSEEMLVNAKSIDGVDDQLLRADLAKFGH